MIRVHHLNRSRSLRILWLLEELDLPYEVMRYERDAETGLAPPDLCALHPLGKSPLIEMSGKLIAESGAIVEAVCARHGAQLVPDPGTDAYLQHLELMHYAEGSAMTPILLNLYVSRLGEAGEPLQPRIQAELANHFGYMETVLRPSGHFVLDDLSAADIMLSFPAEIAMRMGRAEAFPKLAGFVEWVRARPAYQRALTRGGGD
ncbi:glutathione S-transferase family protein [Pukyongiella litopenaei]|uniref:glutathione transferase n=1 Tax=Pukyongiella litopenaei TaxID=2605946 RepID=A0A2S0MKX6_9RHOB|nr:glutathione S-transferase [Pukyongiella litopenaei]AVO36538.1 glutathione S-transferase [Pukyongiella litopenaei]